MDLRAEAGSARSHAPSSIRETMQDAVNYLDQLDDRRRAISERKIRDVDAFDFYTGNTSLAPTDVHSAGLGSAFVGSADIGGAQKGSVTVAGISGTTYIVVVLDTGGTGSSSSTTTTAAAG